MKIRSRYRPYNIRWFHLVVDLFYGTYLRTRYRMRAVGNEVFKRVRGPYVLVPIHQSLLDPFFVSAFVPQSIYWVTSDGNMRSTIMKSLLRLVGSIPKSKSIPDLETIGWIVDVIRKRGGVVGVFAEGQASWDGHSQPIFPSTGKLIKLLKVPVIVAIPKGAWSTLPRWSWRSRPGDIEVEYKLLMDATRIKTLTPDQINDELVAAMEFDEAEWRAAHPVPHRCSRRARHLELSLFMCPACGKPGAMHSFRNHLYCAACGHVVRLSRLYRIMPVGPSVPRFETVREWDLWQRGALDELAAKAAPGVPLFSDLGVMMLKGYRMNPLRRLRTGTLVMYPDRIELATLLGERIAFPLRALEGIATLKQQLFEFYYQGFLYQFRFPLRHQSARKWQMAAEALLKVSPPAST